MRLTILLIILSAPVYSQSKVLPKIDGKINDDEWADAKIFSEFTMIVPKGAEKYYDSTLVYIKQSSDAVYVGIKFWPRGRVIRQSLIRDVSTDEENEFFILLDLENKHKNGYFFAFSFLNNQRDLIIYNQRSMSQEWDWIWQNKSIVYREPKNGEAGYIESEVRIPVDKLQNKNRSQIGIDVQLFGYKPDGSSFFYSISPTSELLTLKGTYEWDIQQFDERVNLNFSATPYVVENRLSDSTKYKTNFGGEVSVSLDKQRLKGTYNTDESTLEADPFNFSLYGTPIFLNEKRPFFSKDLDLYRTPINIFYTRAIHDINYGLNYTYRSDQFKAGVAYVEEEAAPGTPNSDRRIFFVARPNFNFKKLSIGSTIIIDKDPANGREEKIYSVDSKVDLFSRWVLQPQIITSTDRSAYRGTALAYRGHLYYQFNGGGGPYCDLIYNRFDKKFDALTLFNNYGNDYDEMVVGGGYNFVRNAKTFSNVNISTEYYKAQRLSDPFKYQEYVGTNFYYKVNNWLSIDHYFEYNRPDDQVNDSTVVNRTNFLQNHNVKFIYGNHSWVIGYNFGPYYGTYLHNPYSDLALSFGRMAVTFSYRARQTSAIDQKIYRVKLNYRIMDKLYLRSFYQRDTYNNVSLWNSLLQYEFFAGSNVYLVVNLQKNVDNKDLLENVGRYFKFAYEMNF